MLYNGKTLVKFAPFIIMQWNACSLTARFLELKNYLSRVDTLPHIICVQETWLKKGQDFSLPNYRVLRRDRDPSIASRGGGVCTLISNTVEYKLIELTMSLECIVTEIFIE